MRLTIPGRPVPKQRPRRNNRGQVYTPKRTRDYEQTVKQWAMVKRVRPVTGPVKLTTRFYLKDRRHGDLDNLIKAISDALNGIAYEDDRQVLELRGAICYDFDGNERVEVEIEPLEGVS